MNSFKLPADFASRLGQWQSAHGRHLLPWQQDKTPYKVWLSEVMLQQTQVVTAAGYFERFLHAFPSVSKLASAPPEQVMALWSGLGYYSRARNLHACAKIVAEKYAGEFPRTAQELQSLPGIGPSTAAAIASICFHEKIAIFDGNVKRVVSRIAGFDKDLASGVNVSELNSIAQSSLPKNSRDMPRHTQALMDLGATVCMPKKPSCAVCPFETDCVSHAKGLELVVPVNTRKLIRKRMDHHWLWLSRADDSQAVWLQQRPAKGIWAGLWSLPALESSAVDALARQHGWGVHETLPTLKHVLTHRDWYLTPIRFVLSASQAAELDDSDELAPGQWVEKSRFNEMGMPAPIKALMFTS